MGKYRKNNKIQSTFLFKLAISCFLLLLVSIIQEKICYAESKQADRCFLSDISYVTEKTTVSSRTFSKIR